MRLRGHPDDRGRGPEGEARCRAGRKAHAGEGLQPPNPVKGDEKGTSATTRRGAVSAVRRPRSSGGFQVLMWLLSGLLIAFVLLPLVRLAASTPPGSLHAAAASGEVRDAILQSLEDAAITAGIATLFGVPLAYLLARRRLPA